MGQNIVFKFVYKNYTRQHSLTPITHARGQLPMARLTDVLNNHWLGKNHV